MIYFLFFLFELAFLFFLSKKLINSLARIFFKFHFSHKTTVNILAILFLPGTIIHELAHLLIGGVLLVPVGEMNLLPEIHEDGVKLGSVQIGKVDPIRMSLVGVAPILFGVSGILFILTFFNFSIWWQVILGLYLIFEIGNSMFSSKRDLEGVVGFLIAIVLVAGAFLVASYFLKPDFLQTIWTIINNFDLGNVAEFFKTAAKFLLVPLGLDLIIILMTKLI